MFTRTVIEYISLDENGIEWSHTPATVWPDSDYMEDWWDEVVESPEVKSVIRREDGYVTARWTRVGDSTEFDYEFIGGPN